MKTLTLLKTGLGAQWAVQQQRYLAARGVESCFLMPAGPTAEAARQLSGVTVHEMPGPMEQGNRQVLLTWPSAIRRAVKDSGADVIHSHFLATTLAARTALRGRAAPPVVFQVPGPLHLELAMSRALDLRSARRVDRWIAGCRYTEQLLRGGGVDASRVSLAYYSGDPRRWSAGSSPFAPVGDMLPDGQLIVGMVAWTYPPRRGFGGRGIKGHEDFLAAMEQVIGRGHPVHAVLIGGPWKGGDGYHASLQQMARRMLGARHTWVAPVGDVLPWYRRMDIAVHPSLSENLGGAAESMRSGVATIATAVGGFPDLIDDGVTGRLVPPRNPSALADAIEAMVVDTTRRGAMANRGKVHATALLDGDRNADLVHAALAGAFR